jgi:hypothetical protein
MAASFGIFVGITASWQSYERRAALFMISLYYYRSIITAMVGGGEKCVPLI